MKMLESIRNTKSIVSVLGLAAVLAACAAPVDGEESRHDTEGLETAASAEPGAKEGLVAPAERQSAESLAKTAPIMCSLDSIRTTGLAATTVYSFAYDPDGHGIRTVSLKKAWWNEDYYGWAEISGHTRITDRVWMDVSADGGKTNPDNNWPWAGQCGPFSVASEGDRDGTTAVTRGEIAEMHNPNRRFRACADIVVGASRFHKCGPWW